MFWVFDWFMKFDDDTEDFKRGWIWEGGLWLSFTRDFEGLIIFYLVSCLLMMSRMFLEFLSELFILSLQKDSLLAVELSISVIDL